MSGFPVTRARMRSNLDFIYTVEVFDAERVGGAIAEFTLGGEGFKISNDGVNSFGNGQFSGYVDINFLIENDTDLELIRSIQSSNGFRFFIRVYKGALGVEVPVIPYFVGFINPKLIIEPYDSYPFFIQLTAQDLQAKLNEYPKTLDSDDWSNAFLRTFYVDNTACNSKIEVGSVTLQIAGFYGSDFYKPKIFQQGCVDVTESLPTNPVTSLLSSGGNPLFEFMSNMRAKGSASSVPLTNTLMDYWILNSSSTTRFLADRNVQLYFKEMFQLLGFRMFIANGQFVLQDQWEIHKAFQNIVSYGVAGNPTAQRYTEDEYLVYLNDSDGATVTEGGVTFEFLELFKFVNFNNLTLEEEVVYENPYISLGETTEVKMDYIDLNDNTSPLRRHEAVTSLGENLPGIVSAPAAPFTVTEFINTCGDVEAKPYIHFINLLFEQRSVARRTAKIKVYSEKRLTPSNYYEFETPNINGRFIIQKFTHLGNYDDYELTIQEICKREYGWWASGSNVLITNNNRLNSVIRKNTGAAGFNSGSRSTYEILEGYFCIKAMLLPSGDGTFETDELSFGFTTNAKKDVYTTVLDGMGYHIQIDGDFKAKFENTTLATLAEEPEEEDVIWILYDTKDITFWRNGTLIHREEQTLTFPLFVKFMGNTQNAGVGNVKTLCRDVKRN